MEITPPELFPQEFLVEIMKSQFPVEFSLHWHTCYLVRYDMWEQEKILLIEFMVLLLTLVLDDYGEAEFEIQVWFHLVVI
jgi:hypothetical protein